jgi:hypothetical protein
LGGGVAAALLRGERQTGGAQADGRGHGRRGWVG